VDAEGRFEASGLPPGKLDVLVRDAYAGLELSEEVTLGPAETATVRIVAPSDVIVVGGTLTVGGEPIAQARVTVQARGATASSFRRSSARSDSQGAYAVAVPEAGTFHLSVWTDQVGTGRSLSWSGRLDVPSVPEHVHDVALWRISGRLVDEAGRPLAMRISARTEQTGGSGDRTDVGGAFELLVQAGQYELRVFPAKGGKIITLEEALTVTGDVHLGDIVVRLPTDR
jgi:hypothetical protein